MSTITSELEKLWEHNRTMLPTPPRKLQITKQSNFFRARYEGEAVSVFVDDDDPRRAERALRFFRGER